MLQVPVDFVERHQNILSGCNLLLSKQLSATLI